MRTAELHHRKGVTHVTGRNSKLIDRLGAKVREVAERSEKLSDWLEAYDRVDLDEKPGIPYSL